MNTGEWVLLLVWRLMKMMMMITWIRLIIIVTIRFGQAKSRAQWRMMLSNDIGAIATRRHIERLMVLAAANKTTAGGFQLWTMRQTHHIRLAGSLQARGQALSCHMMMMMTMLTNAASATLLALSNNKHLFGRWIWPGKNADFVDATERCQTAKDL